MSEELARTRKLLGEPAMRKLAASRVAVFGLGGVGGYAVEALVRSGVGAIDLIDSDIISPSNLNRQILATHSTIGRYKVDVAAERIADISKACKVTKRIAFFLPETADEFDFGAFDYVVDAIDTVAGKLALVKCAKAAGVPIISAMGAGNKLDPTAFEVDDIFATSVCPLAKVMRRELRKMGIDGLKVVYSKEEPFKPFAENETNDEAEQPHEFGSAEKSNSSSQQLENGSSNDARSECEGKTLHKDIPGSVAFVPSVMGLILAAEVIKDLINRQ